MNTEEAVNYYHSLLKFGIKPGLERIKKLMDILGNPQDELKYIHIAGTNGKGSTAVMLSEIFKAAGYTTGLYISPYITDFRERIQINNQMISENNLIECTEAVKSAIDILAEDGDEITEFEAVTAAAFLCFKSCKCDIVILETGLGGRFDATNIIKEPLFSIITSISFDHTAILGDTLEKIAFEKCGIIKPDCPVAASDRLPLPAMNTIKNVCKDRNSALYTVKKSDIEIEQEEIDGINVQYRGISFKIHIPGTMQSVNAALCIEAVKNCRGYDISDEQIIKGIENAKNPARLEVINKNPLILLDGSHNSESTAMLADYIGKHLKDKKITAIMGMMADKEIDKVLDNLVKHFDFVYTTVPSNPRAIDAEELKKKILAYGVNAKAIKDPINAVLTALEKIKENGNALVICGSLYLAGDIRNILINKVDEIF